MQRIQLNPQLKSVSGLAADYLSVRVDGRVQRLATDERLQMRVLFAVQPLLNLALDKDGETLCLV